MPSLYITEFPGLYSAEFGNTQLAVMPPLAEQKVTIGSEVDSAALNAKTGIVRLHADAICSVLFATGDPTATTDNMRLAADQTEYFAVTVGSGLVISVIANT